MSLIVDIQKKLGTFQLQVQFDTQQQPLALLGASGCGKSLTLKCIAGILKPDAGRIVLNGVTVFDSAAKIDLPPQRRQVGYLFQHYALFPHMSVLQNIAVAVKDRSRRRQVSTQLMECFQLSAVADLRPEQLSGGQQQRCALARILAAEPQAILLDEPLSALDSYLRFQLEADLAGFLSQFPGPVVWVTHDQGEARRNCPRVCVLDQGHSQEVQTMDSLLRAPKTEAAARLCGWENFADAQAEGEFVRLPQWGLLLKCSAPFPQDAHRVGIRAGALHLAPAVGGENVFSCFVVQQIRDLSLRTLLLRPEGAPRTAPLLRGDFKKELFPGEVPDRLLVSIPPDALLPL